jgi:hypothetical protein
MPPVAQSAELRLNHKIDLPLSPPVVVLGRNTKNEPVCQLEISATGVKICGPEGGVIQNLTWEGLVDLARNG